LSCHCIQEVMKHMKSFYPVSNGSLLIETFCSLAHALIPSENLSFALLPHSTMEQQLYQPSYSTATFLLVAHGGLTTGAPALALTRPQ
jgi:hypothetical protein